VNTEKLSRKSRYCDRFRGESGKAVKKKKEFGQVSRHKEIICPNAQKHHPTRTQHQTKTSPNPNSHSRRLLIHIILKLKRTLQRNNAVKDFLVFCCVLRIDVEVAVAEELEFILRLGVLHVWLNVAVHDFQGFFIYLIQE
jgi:hypothetical protein